MPVRPTSSRRPAAPPTRVLVVSSHDDGFAAALEGADGLSVAVGPLDDLVDAAPRRSPAGIDVVVVHEAHGIVAEPDGQWRFPAAPERLVASVHRLLHAGVGVVVVHDALGAWPAWPEWAELAGAQFLHIGDVVRGRRFPASARAFGARVHLRAVADHPVVASLAGAGLELVDEPFLCPVLEESLVALARTDHATTAAAFGPGVAAWHPPGSDAAVWVKRWLRAPVVVVQPGAGPSTWADPGYQTLLADAVRWAGSAEARDWADPP